MERELKTEFDSRKSFYKKAKVRDENGQIILKSYSTDVCIILDEIAVVEDTYSPTTLRHIKEFLKQNGFKAESKQQILKDYTTQK